MISGNREDPWFESKERNYNMNALLHWTEIKVGQIWRPTDGSKFRVEVTQVTCDEIFYRDVNDSSKKWDKSPFCFQIRYTLDEVLN
jgi:hypothetical protein